MLPPRTFVCFMGPWGGKCLPSFFHYHEHLRSICHIFPPFFVFGPLLQTMESSLLTQTARISASDSRPFLIRPTTQQGSKSGKRSRKNIPPFRKDWMRGCVPGGNGNTRAYEEKEKVHFLPRFAPKRTSKRTRTTAGVKVCPAVVPLLSPCGGIWKNPSPE